MLFDYASMLLVYGSNCRSLLRTLQLPPKDFIFLYTKEWFQAHLRTPVATSTSIWTPPIDLYCKFNADAGRLKLKLVTMKLLRKLEVWKMGTVKYLDALKLQEKLLADRKCGKVPDTLLSLQHPPTYTLGKRRTCHNLLVPEADLKTIGAEIHDTERGGDITFHGPRQAILYPIISLRDIGFGARMYVQGLESAMVELASLYGVSARSGVGCETGVWVRDKKIGAVGVRISSGLTSHGLAFNIDPDLSYFKYIVPCGISDKGVTSLGKETQMELPDDEVIHEQLIKCLAAQFHFSDIQWKDVASELKAVETL